MPVFVKGHVRKGRQVKAYSRGSAVRLNSSGRMMAGFSHLRGKKLTVQSNSIVNFASGPQKYAMLSYKKRTYSGKMKRETIEIAHRFLSALAR